MQSEREYSMSQNKNQERRERIMNSEKQLPGDKDRAQNEAINDFDAGDTGNFDTRTAGRTPGDPRRKQEVNENEGQLPGDFEREADDKRVDQSIHADKKKD
jgi:hypothetical protein